MVLSIKSAQLKNVRIAVGSIPPPPEPMLLVINSSYTGDVVQLPFDGDYGIYTITVNWGDGTVESFTSDGQRPVHTYSASDIYNITVTGTAATFGTTNTDMSYLTGVSSFGNLGLTSLRNAFRGAANLTSLPESLPSTVTNLSNMLAWATSFNGDITLWNTSNVTSFDTMFSQAQSFNQNIGSWNTSSALYMTDMFYNALAFNQPLGNWDTSNVQTMDGMFNSSAFNQDISGWNTINVTDMSYMFENTAFNQPIGSWNTSSVSSMFRMFFNSAFNQNINGWNTSGVVDMVSMFEGNTVFNQPLSSWDTSSTEFMESMFSGCTAFDQDLSAWSVPLIPSYPYNFAYGTPIEFVAAKLPWPPLPPAPNSVSFDVVNTNNATQNTVNITIPVTTGQWISFSMQPGFQPGVNTYYVGEPYLLLFYPNGDMVLDGYTAQSPSLTVQAEVDGDYSLHIGALQDTQCYGVASWNVG